MEYDKYSLGEQACWAITSLKAPVDVPESRSSTDIVVVLDKSASMNGKKMNMVKKTLQFVIDQRKFHWYTGACVYINNHRLYLGLAHLETDCTCMQLP